MSSFNDYLKSTYSPQPFEMMALRATWSSRFGCASTHGTPMPDERKSDLEAIEKMSSSGREMINKSLQSLHTVLAKIAGASPDFGAGPEEFLTQTDNCHILWLMAALTDVAEQLDVAESSARFELGRSLDFDVHKQWSE